MNLVVEIFPKPSPLEFPGQVFLATGDTSKVQGIALFPLRGLQGKQARTKPSGKSSLNSLGKGANLVNIQGPSLIRGQTRSLR